MSRRAFVVAPNIGIYMGCGGGVRTALAIAKVLENTGYEPLLVALRGYSIHRLVSIHGIELNRAKALYFFGEGKPLKVPFPLQVSLLKTYLEKALMRYQPEIVVFNDDIPVVNEKILNDARVILYSHFPYAARLKFNVTDVYEIPPDKIRTYLDIMHRKSLGELIYVSHVYPGATLVSNSTVTRIFIKMLWHRDSKTVYPPLIVPHDLIQSHRDKRNYVTVLATIQPNKRIGEVIKALGLLKDDKAKLLIIGHKGSGRYMAYLVELAKQLKIDKKIVFLTDIGEHDKWQILAKSKVIVSAAHFEPFGIAVIEGMYMNNIPIVYKGPLSGPWIDIVDKGKYGLGFRSVKELAELINLVLQDYDLLVRELSPSTRAERFNYRRFGEQLVKILQ